MVVDETLRAEPLRLAAGARLLGPYEGSGLREQHYLVERGDGQVVHVSRLLHLVASTVDGRRDGQEVAERVSLQYGRQLTADGLDYLVEHKLRPAGVLAPAGAEHGPPPAARPLLALRLRRTLLPVAATRRVAGVLAPLFFPPVVAVVLVWFAIVDVAVLRSGEVLPALQAVLGRPDALVGVLGLLLLSALFHECGHAAACAYSGARPGAIGVGLYLVMPAFYTDVTAAYQLNRTGRLRTDLGGLYFNALAVLGLAGGYAATGSPVLLLAIALVNLEMLQQLLPVIRLDGYFILSDLVGVPDLFGRIGPVLSSLLPGRPVHPRAAQLRPYARAVVTVWVLVVVPLLVASLVVVTVRLPTIVRTTEQAISADWAALLAAHRAGSATGVLLAAVAIVFLALPLLGLLLLYENLARRGVRSTLRLARRRRPGGPAVTAAPAGPDGPDLHAVPTVAEPAPADLGAPLTAAAFTEAELLRARPGSPPASGWRRAVWEVSGGRLDPGPSEAERRERALLDRIGAPVNGCRRIVVLSRKGGAGKTTTALMLGHTFAAHRGDRIVALDANPDAGSLAYRVRRESAASATSLLADDSMTGRYCDMRSYTSQSVDTRLEVIASDDDPRISRALGEEAYRRILALLDLHYQLVVVDTGTGILDSSVQGLIAEADQIVLVMPPALDGVRVAAATLDWLDEHGYAPLVRRAVAVVNAVRDERVIRLDRVEAHFDRRCAGTVRVPWDRALQAGGHTRLDELNPTTRRAYLAPRRAGRRRLRRGRAGPGVPGRSRAVRHSPHRRGRRRRGGPVPAARCSPRRPPAGSDRDGDHPGRGHRPARRCRPHRQRLRRLDWAYGRPRRHATSPSRTPGARDCRALAVSFQVVLVRRLPAELTLTNRALAVTDRCRRCEALSWAYQWVVVTGTDRRLSPSGQWRLRLLERRLRLLVRSRPPIATADSPAYELRIEMTVGMSAPPIGMISSTPNASARMISSGNTQPDQPWAGYATSSRPIRTANRQQAEVAGVLMRVGHRPLRDPAHSLQLGGGQQAARQREEAEDHFDDDRQHPHRRELRLPFAEPQVVLRGADQSGRQSAEGVRERRPLRHGGQRHHRQRNSRARRRRGSPARIQP